MLFEWIGVEAQNLKTKKFIWYWKGVTQMHWLPRIHLGSEGIYLNFTWGFLWGHLTYWEFTSTWLGSFLCLKCFECWKGHLRDKLGIGNQEKYTWVFLDVLNVGKHIWGIRLIILGQNDHYWSQMEASHLQVTTFLPSSILDSTPMSLLSQGVVPRQCPTQIAISLSSHLWLGSSWAF